MVPSISWQKKMVSRCSLNPFKVLAAPVPSHPFFGFPGMPRAPQKAGGEGSSQF